MDEPLRLEEVRRRGTQRRVSPSASAFRGETIYPDRVLFAREAIRYSLAELALETGIGEGDLALFESGLLMPTETQVAELARCTGFPRAWFSQPPAKGWPGIEQTSLHFH